MGRQVNQTKDTIRISAKESASSFVRLSSRLSVHDDLAHDHWTHRSQRGTVRVLRTRVKTSQIDRPKCYRITYLFSEICLHKSNIHLAFIFHIEYCSSANSIPSGSNDTRIRNLQSHSHQNQVYRGNLIGKVCKVLPVFGVVGVPCVSPQPPRQVGTTVFRFPILTPSLHRSLYRPDM